MNLAKRASLLILPVVILSYTLMGWFIYERECRAIAKFEQNKLEQRADHLKFAYVSNSRFIVSYLSSLIEGGVLSAYLNGTDDVYRQKMLTSHLKTAVKRFEGKRQIFASIALFNNKDELNLFIQNSDDPFAEISQQQRNLVKQMNEQKQFNLWNHLSVKGQSVVQRGITLDSRTLFTPVLFDQSEVTKIVIEVKAARYDELLLQTKQEYNARVRYLPNEVPASAIVQGLSTQVKLASNYILVIEPAKQYFSELLSELQLRLLLIMLLSIVFTFSLLQWLILRFITDPISLLDRQLTDIIAGTKSTIDINGANHEVGRLGRKFQSLYEELNSAFKESYAQARIDSLTQLPNRISFNEVAVTALMEAKNTHSELSIVYIDLDDFKFVNDKYGHEVGDQLLKSLAVRFSKLIATNQSNDIIVSKSTPLVFRLSGDEFIALLPSYGSEAAKQLGENILGLFSYGFELENKCLTLSASIGISSYPNDGDRVFQLVSNADLAMYQAKKTGRNRVALYSNALAEDDRRLKEIEVRLKDVDADKEFTPYYMPIVDKEGKYKGFEVLLRWHSPHIGWVSPADFIPVAESCGVYEMIDMWVIEQTFKNYTFLQSLWPTPFTISINVSSAELNSDRFITQLEELSVRYAIPVGSFILEITETFAMEQSVDTIDWLDNIRQLGFKIAIDDFGTGYTSLMQMVDYPVDVIKLDKQLVERITQVKQQHLAKALINLCHIQGISVVAEGIETQSQSSSLKQANCDFQQGFLIAKPMPLCELQEWLNQHRLQAG
jgi:diguanylate cyclase (GGDEF)-like protein